MNTPELIEQYKRRSRKLVRRYNWSLISALAFLAFCFLSYLDLVVTRRDTRASRATFSPRKPSLHIIETYEVRW